MATFTVFAFGTGELSTMPKKNIVSQFSEACTGDHTIIEGPGNLGIEVPRHRRRTADEIIKWLSAQDSVENNVNLTGFSRGSVTCIRIANQLKKYEEILIKKQNHEKLTRIERKLLKRLNGLEISLDDLLQRLQALNVNIFAPDPVAGLKDKKHMQARVIPSNVKNYVAMIQMDEMRRDFKPQDISRIILASPDTTKVTLLPMFGCHSDSTKIKNEGMQSGPKLAWYALYQFLTLHGTTFKDDKLPQIVTSQMTFSDLPENPTSKDLLKIFATYHQERDAYLASGQSSKLVDGIPLPRKIRSFNRHLEFYVKNSDFFVNQLERELFKVSYPKAFNYLFEKNQFDLRFPEASHCDKPEVIAELGLLKQENPDLFARLKRFGVHESAQSITLDQPSGSYCLEPCNSLQQIYPHFVPASVIAYANQINNLAKLETAIYSLTFRYEREKSELSPFAARPQAGYARTIRAQIKSIIDETPGDSKTKYLKVLDNIEQHYSRLIRSRNQSELTSMLQELLEKYGRSYQVETESLPRAILANFLSINFTLVKEVVSFIGHGGYIGSGILAFLGGAFQDFGYRCNELLGNLGYNPFKYVASALAYTFEGLGYLLKHSFGLRPLTRFICACIDNIKNEMVIACGSVKISKMFDESSDISSDIAEISEDDSREISDDDVLFMSGDDSDAFEMSSDSDAPGLSDDDTPRAIPTASKASDTGLFARRQRADVAQGDNPLECDITSSAPVR